MTMWRSVARVGKSILTAAMLVGCSSVPTSSPMRFTIEELGSEGVTFTDSGLQFRTAVNITGVSQPVSTGGFLTVPGGRVPELMSVPVTPGCSRIVETVYKTSASASDVNTIGTSIERIRAALAEGVAVSLRQQLLIALQTRIELVKKDGKKPQEDGPAMQMAAALGLASVPSDDEMKKLTQNLADEAQEARKKVSSAQDELLKLKDARNIMIARWQTQDNRNLGAKLGDFFSLGSSRSEMRSGYLIMAGIRTASLELGEDALIGLAQFADRDDGVLRFLSNTQMVTFTMSAQYHYFAEDRDLSSLLRTSLRLSAEELDQIFGGAFTAFIKAQSLAIEASIASALASGNRGLISEPRRTVYPYRLHRTLVRLRSADAERIRNEGYTTIYSIRSALQELQIPRATAWMVEHCDHSFPAGKSLNDIGAYAMDFVFCMPLDEDKRRLETYSKIYETQESQDEKDLKRKKGEYLSSMRARGDQARCLDLLSPIKAIEEGRKRVSAQQK